LLSSVNPSTCTEYRDELADLMRERFGRGKDRPTRYKAASSLAGTAASLLSEEDYAGFLRAALRAERETKQPGQPVGWRFSNFYALALSDEVGDLDAAPGRREAWHILRAVHDILPGGQFTPFIQCARDAWEDTLDLLQRVPVRG
jgi:hypothetical protein